MGFVRNLSPSLRTIFEVDSVTYANTGTKRMYFYRSVRVRETIVKCTLLSLTINLTPNAQELYFWTQFRGTAVEFSIFQPSEC